jgi:hypothetical protein
MGYSHHWTYQDHFSRGAWTALCEDAIILITHFAYPLQGTDTKGPTVDHDEIYLVPGRVGVEHFQLTIDPTPHMAHCKTEWTPFDQIVYAILAVAAERNPSMRIVSDGEASDWEPHIAWAAGCLRRPIKAPVLLADL